jgi:hypothetical protein
MIGEPKDYQQSEAGQVHLVSKAPLGKGPVQSVQVTADHSAFASWLHQSLRGLPVLLCLACRRSSRGLSVRRAGVSLWV